MEKKTYDAALKPFYAITSKIECQTFDRNNEPLFSLDQMVFAMGEYNKRQHDGNLLLCSSLPTTDELFALIDKMHKCSVYQLSPLDDRCTHLPFELFGEVETMLLRRQLPDVGGSADTIKFGAYLTGHDEKTIKQMLNDYQRHL